MRLVLFGCSHTATHFQRSFDDDYEILNKAYNGNSNQKIIDDVYHFVNQKDSVDDFLPNDILIIQYSYTNRLWFPNKLPENGVSFHSFDKKSSPIYYKNKFASNELFDFYSSYIKYFWSYETAFRTHSMNMDFLKTYLESKNIKFIHWMYTDGGNTSEWNSGFNKFWKKESSNDVFSKLGLFNIDGEYRIKDWAIKNNFVDDTDHINENGNLILAENISKIIKKML